MGGLLRRYQLPKTALGTYSYLCRIYFKPLVLRHAAIRLHRGGLVGPRLYLVHCLALGQCPARGVISNEIHTNNLICLVV
jgi:hypothetical protein